MDERVERALEGLVEAPSAIRGKGWVDADGKRWVRRGGGVEVKRAERLLASADVRVLHFCGPDAPVEVAVGDRAALWERVRPYLRGRGKEVHADFAVAEFRDGQRRTMLVIEESC
ncbi:hypothetical protein [Actinokineospora bangkokensis]|uniref:Uncharacterized protein n=1 Tax=Actinokineospora bangkokensis TaxID=1193682 RepID=A0A1Q9LR08_9PSEU|nr:hypothetical protein [Actinokineospora bangkokensis]OLR94434.1 hypothetical protein BJP25_11800 [Actinokineospora bangkokensis]